MTALLWTEFAITRSRPGAAATMTLHGELDLAVAAHVVAEFEGLLASGPTAVIVDLRELSFMDVSGMHALLALRTSCEQQGRRFVLVRGQRAVHRLLALCRLERTFELVDSLAEAVELTGTADGPLTATAPKPRSSSRPDCAEDQRRTGAPIDDEANRAMCPRQDPIAAREPCARRPTARGRTAREQRSVRPASRRPQGLG